MKYFYNILKVSNFDQTASDPTGIIIIVNDLVVH
jgi:hypothetical protein